MTPGDRIQLLVTLAVCAMVAMILDTPDWFRAGMWFAVGWLAWSVWRAVQ